MSPYYLRWPWVVFSNTKWNYYHCYIISPSVMSCPVKDDYFWSTKSTWLLLAPLLNFSLSLSLSLSKDSVARPEAEKNIAAAANDWFSFQFQQSECVDDQERVALFSVLSSLVSSFLLHKTNRYWFSHVVHFTSKCVKQNVHTYFEGHCNWYYNYSIKAIALIIDR